MEKSMSDKKVNIFIVTNLECKKLQLLDCVINIIISKVNFKKENLIITIRSIF